MTVPLQKVPMRPEQTARLYYQLFNERRFDEAARLVDRQVSIHYRPTRQHLVGRAGYYALAMGWVNAFDDVSLEILTLDASGDHSVIVTLLGRGTHTGALVLGDALSLPPTGRKAQLRVRETLEIRNGLIVSEELDFDIEEMRKALLG
jgi:predicted ester cyclase